MEKKDLESLKLAIKRADIFAIIAFIILFILILLQIANIHHLIGFILGYVAVKFVYYRQYKIYATKEVSIGVNIFLNIGVYAIVMFLAVLISFEVFIILAFVILIYRNIVLYSFKSLCSQ
ncbi:MAG: hypothetical protein ACK5HR_06375 [Mycoplasmatales bacterium]